MAGLDAHFRCSIALFTPQRDKRRIHRSNSSRVCAHARTYANARKCIVSYRSVHTLPVAISVSFSFSLPFSFLPSLPGPFSRSRFIRVRSITLRFLSSLLAMFPCDSCSVNRRRRYPLIIPPSFYILRCVRTTLNHLHTHARNHMQGAKG